MTENVHYPEIEDWSDEKLTETYKRLSRDLHRRGFRMELVERMMIVERYMRDEGLDPEAAANAAIREVNEDGVIVGEESV